MTLYARQQKRHRCIEEFLDCVGEGKGGMIWESSTETCILSYVKQITSPGSMHETECSGLVHWDDPEGWEGRDVGGGSGWGTHVHPRLIHVNVLQKPLLLLLLSRFSRVRPCGTPKIAAHQAPPSPGFSRQGHWSGLPFPSPMHESEKRKWSRSVVPDLSDPMGFSRQEYWSGMPLPSPNRYTKLYLLLGWIPRQR